MALKPTELLLMPEELKKKLETTESKISSSNVTTLDNANKTPNNSPRVLFFYSFSPFHLCLTCEVVGFVTDWWSFCFYEERECVEKGLFWITLFKSRKTTDSFFEWYFLSRKLFLERTWEIHGYISSSLSRYPFVSLVINVSLTIDCYWHVCNEKGVHTLVVVGGTVWCGCLDGTITIYEIRVLRHEKWQIFFILWNNSLTNLNKESYPQNSIQNPRFTFWLLFSFLFRVARNWVRVVVIMDEFLQC